MPTPLSRYSPQDAINQQTKSLKVDEAAIQNMIQQLGGGQFSGGPAIQINGGYQQPSVQRDMASLEAAMLMSNADNNPDRYGGRVANRAMQGKALRLENDAQMGQQMEADAMAQAQQMQAMQQQQLAEQEEIEVRKQYVAGLDPIVAERFPNLSPDERKQFLLSTYSQKLSPEKLFADEKGEPEKASIMQDANGRNRYVDGPKAGTLVFDGIEIEPDLEKNLSTEAGYRKEFNGLLTDYNKVNDAYSRVLASAEEPSAAGDMAMIFNYMKILDPGSTVREGEYASARDATGAFGKVWSMYNKAKDGKNLNPEQRADFVDRSTRLFEAAKGEAQKTADAYTMIADEAGVNAQSVIANFTVRNGGQQSEQAPLSPYEQWKRDGGK